MTANPKRILREDLSPIIIKHAALLFAERGFEPTTMQDIASRVGITAAGLYYYFPSKQSILFEVLETSLEAVVSTVEGAVSAEGDGGTQGPAAQLHAFTRSHVRFQIERAEESAVYAAAFYGSHHLLNALAEDQRVRLRELQHKSFDLLRRILRDGIDAGKFTIVEMTATASAIIGIGEYVPAWFRPGGRLTPDEIGIVYANLALRMVGAHDELIS